MKRRTEHLVLKRDGRTEFLRATKLARSIHLALHSVGVDEDWRAIEIASVALQTIRAMRSDTSNNTMPLPWVRVVTKSHPALTPTVARKRTSPICRSVRLAL